MSGSRSDIRPHQSESVDGSIGHAENPLQGGVQVRFQAERLCRRDLLNSNTGPEAGSEPVIGIARIITGQEHEQASGVINAAPGDPLQDGVLLPALPGRLGIVDGVTGAAVQQPVKPGTGTVGQVLLFRQNGVHTAQRQVSQHPRPGGASPDHQNIRLLHGHSSMSAHPLASTSL